MGSLLERLAEREAAARGRVERLRAEIASLSAELAAVEETVSRLVVTRETVLSVLAADDDGDAGVAAPPAAAEAGDAVAGSAAYRQVLDVFAGAGRPLRAKDVCQALGAGSEPRQVEGMRAKLKRLVRRRVLAEPEPGQFVMAGPAAVAGPVVTTGEEEQ